MKTPADYCAAIAEAMKGVPKVEWSRHCGHVHIPETDNNRDGDINMNAVFNKLVGKLFARYIAACHPLAMRSILEERAQTKAAREQDAMAVGMLTAQVAGLQQELAEAKKDTARLDHIEKHAHCDPKMDGSHVWWPTSFNNALRGHTLRAAIDAALKDPSA